MRKINKRITFFFSQVSKQVGSFFSRIDTKFVFGNKKERNLIALLPIIGYAIIIMSFVDFVFVLFPFQLQNPQWELKTIGTFTEQTWAFLIGLGFIFTRYFTENKDDVRSLEIFFLKFIRWFLLFVAIASFFAIPLIFSNTNRVLNFLNEQVSEQKNNAFNQISQLENRLTKTSNLEQLRLFSKSLNLAPDVLNLPASELQNTIKTNLGDTRKKIAEKSAQKQKQQSIEIWKSSIKTIIGLIITGFTFVISWFKIGKTFK